MRMAFTRLKATVVAAIPSDRVRTAAMVKPGLRANCLNAYLRSCLTSFIPPRSFPSGLSMS